MPARVAAPARSWVAWLPAAPTWGAGCALSLMTVRRGRGYTGLSSADAAIDYCRRHLAVPTFDECRYPFYAVAVSLGQGRKVVFSSGELAPRMMASAAMPVLYRPVKIDGEYYCDGALIELAPMDAICCKHHLDAVIIHHVSQRLDEPGSLDRALHRRWAMAEILSRLLYHQRPWYLSEERLTVRRCPDGCGAVVVVIEPDLPELRWPLTDGGPRVLEAGEGADVRTVAAPFRRLADRPTHMPADPSHNGGSAR